MDAESLLTVGQVASRSGLTAKALRRYDRISLLRPAHVDTANGYRLYTDRALAAAQDIAEAGDRELLLADLETIPGQARYW
jgi:DNA-binding transcriptional MerR regulator